MGGGGQDLALGTSGQPVDPCDPPQAPKDRKHHVVGVGRSVCTRHVALTREVWVLLPISLK